MAVKNEAQAWKEEENLAVKTLNASIITPITNCHNFTGRSEKARLRNNFFKLTGIDEAFDRSIITTNCKRFPMAVTAEKNSKVRSTKASLMHKRSIRELDKTEQVVLISSTRKCKTG